MLRKGFSDRQATYLRYLGTFCLVVGYFILLWGDMRPALFLRVTGDLLLLPSSYKMKLYDIVGLQLLFATIDIVKIIQIFS